MISPVTTEGRKIKKQDGKPVADTEDPDLATEWPSVLMRMKPGAKKISGQPDRRSLVVDQRTDKLQQRLVLWSAGPSSQEFTDVRVGDLSS
jgi:hypothetical protein